MKSVTLVFAALFLLVSFSLCLAQEVSLEEAYSLYYKGEKDKAIELMEDHVKDNPDPGILYFLGYAYYEMKQMDKAREYFTKAYKHKDFFSPMSKETD
ncbi:MAG: tetratricopeptide repeat protein [Nitrospirota bacterium]